MTVLNSRSRLTALGDVWAWGGIFRNSDFPRFQCGAWFGADLWGSENLEFVRGRFLRAIVSAILA